MENRFKNTVTVTDAHVGLNRCINRHMGKEAFVSIQAWNCLSCVGPRECWSIFQRLGPQAGDTLPVHHKTHIHTSTDNLGKIWAPERNLCQHGENKVYWLNWDSNQGPSWFEVTVQPMFWKTLHINGEWHLHSYWSLSDLITPSQTYPEVTIVGLIQIVSCGTKPVSGLEFCQL